MSVRQWFFEVPFLGKALGTCTLRDPCCFTSPQERTSNPTPRCAPGLCCSKLQRGPPSPKHGVQDLSGESLLNLVVESILVFGYFWGSKLGKILMEADLDIRPLIHPAVELSQLAHCARHVWRCWRDLAEPPSWWNLKIQGHGVVLRNWENMCEVSCGSSKVNRVGISKNVCVFLCVTVTMCGNLPTF